MSNENLKISLSAVMDNAENELELRRILNNTDDNVMATWSRYHIVRAIIGKDVIYPKLDIALAVREAIRQEELSNISAKNAVIAKQKDRHSTLASTIVKLAVAASILAVTLLSAYFFNNEGVMPSNFVERTHKTDDLTVATNDWIEQRLSNFVDRHEQKGILTIDDYDQIVNSSNTITN